MGVSYSTDYCATPFLCYILDYKFSTQNWWKCGPVQWFQESINWTSLFGGKGVTEGAGIRFSDQFLWTHSRDRASFFWNSSSWSWLSRFLLRRLGEQKHVGLEKHVSVTESWFSVFVLCVCECVCVLSQPLQLLQVIKSSSLNVTDLVLHQMTAIKNKDEYVLKTNIQHKCTSTVFLCVCVRF